MTIHHLLGDELLTGPLKNLIDRILIPLGEPHIELREGHCHHPLRKEVKSGTVVLVSNCGYWELDNFDLLLAHMKAFCEHAERKFAGALLRPHGPVMYRAWLSDSGFRQIEQLSERWMAAIK